MKVRESAAVYNIAATKQQPSVPIGAGIPSDWKVVFAAEVCAKIQDGTHFSPRINGGPYLYVTSKNIKRGHLDLSTAETIDAVQHSAIYRRCDVKKGDLLLTKDGANTGNAALNSLDEEFSLLSSVAFLRFSQQHSAAYFLQQILSTRGQRQIEEAMAGNAITRLTLQKINQLRFLTPPTLVEQQAIAEALADADALIESVSLLLAKKRQIKQGAMQELLTGKKRMPGFNKDWASKRLDQLAAIRSGGTPSTTQNQFWNGDILWCTPTDITALNGHKYLSDTERKLTSLGARASAAELIPPRSIVMTSRATIGECAINTVAVTTNQGFKNFVPFDNVDVEYLYYLLQIQRPGFIGLCSGSTFLEIGKTQLSAYEVVVPVEKSEQAAISRALSEMDESISTLEDKLTKARDIKQAMMQALLTGRIRLVQPVSNVIPLPIKSAVADSPSLQSAHNWQINEAVVIGVLAQRFGNEKFPLPRKRRVKLMYLLHRHSEGRADGYLKKAAGPYDPNTKYKGPEAIALKSGYVQVLRNDKYEGFVAGDKIEQAQRYFEQWYGTAALEWLEQFRYRKTDDLELLATVDMAMVDLATSGELIDVAGIKRVIVSHSAWVPKLSRALFSDDNIAGAITKCQALFNG